MTNRQDMHLEAMLRHLGAAYYDSLSGRAARGEVRRAVARAAGQLGRESAAEGQDGSQSGQQVLRHHGQLHCRVRDVMATQVVTVEPTMPFKDIARVLVERRVSGVPILLRSGHPAGMVTEGDLLRASDRHVECRLRSRSSRMPRSRPPLTL